MRLGLAADEADFSDDLESCSACRFSLYRRRAAVHAGQALAEPTIRFSGGELPPVTCSDDRGRGSTRPAAGPEDLLTEPGARPDQPRRRPRPRHRSAGRFGMPQPCPLRAARSIPQPGILARARRLGRGKRDPGHADRFRGTRRRGISSGVASTARGSDGEELVRVSRGEVRAAGDRSRGGRLRTRDSRR